MQALERHLLAHPDDTATWMVYADALQASGDPRGDVLALGDRLARGDTSVAALYAARCRAARWPRSAPFPKMHYRVRFEQLVAELRALPGATIRELRLGAPDLDAVARWQATAGAAWPVGMTELYEEVGTVDLDWQVDRVRGGIHLPDLSLWDHAALEDELWFDFTEPDSALHAIRPIDRFVPEAYTVLYLATPGEPARVAYHYCGEQLVPTELTYREWLELLFRSRGVTYWMLLAINSAPTDYSWVAGDFERAAAWFPDFDPTSMHPRTVPDEVPL